MKVIGIIGTRRRNQPEDFSAVEKKFFDLYQEGDWICSGGCYAGGDRFAEVISKKHGIPILIFPANWNKYGKKAGFIRNQYIANNSDVIIACVSEDRKGGTEHTIQCFITYNGILGTEKVHLV